MEKKVKKNSKPYYTFVLRLAGLKECADAGNGKPGLCPLQPVSQEQLNWK